jgi:hypothetical protein
VGPFARADRRISATSGRVNSIGSGSPSRRSSRTRVPAQALRQIAAQLVPVEDLDSMIIARELCRPHRLCYCSLASTRQAGQPNDESVLCTSLTHGDIVPCSFLGRGLWLESTS